MTEIHKDNRGHQRHGHSSDAASGDEEGQHAGHSKKDAAKPKNSLRNRFNAHREELRKLEVHHQLTLWFSAVSVLFSFFLLIATAVYAWITWHQLEEMRSNGRQTQDLLKIADRQAAAAEDAYRPWVGLDGDIKLRGVAEVQFRSEKATLTVPISYTIKNTGNSPALRVNDRIFVELLDSESKAPDAGQACNIQEAGSSAGEGSTIIPGAQITRDVSLNQVLLPTNTDIRQGVWLVGCIAYQDAKHHTHRTKIWSRSSPIDSTALTYNPYTKRPIVYAPFTSFQGKNENPD